MQIGSVSNAGRYTYWFTSSTSFANPAVTLARAASDTFAGIRPADATGFIVAQLAGAAIATAVFSWLLRDKAALSLDFMANAGEDRSAQTLQD